MEARRPHFSQLDISLPGFSGSVLDFPLGDLWPLYLSASAGKSAASLNADGVAWRRLVKFADDCRIKDLTRQTARDWLRWLAELRLDSQTLRAYLASCRRVWRLVEACHPELADQASPLFGGAGKVTGDEVAPDSLEVARLRPAMNWQQCAAERLLEAQRRASGGAPARLSDLWAMYELLKGPASGLEAALRDFERAAWQDLLGFMNDCPALGMGVERLALWATEERKKQALKACRRVLCRTGRYYGLGDGSRILGSKALRGAGSC